MRTIGAALTAATFVAASMFSAADAASPLPAGKPAGVAEAQNQNPNLLIALGAGVVIAGIVLVATGNDNNSLTTPTTKATTTTTTKKSSTTTTTTR